MEQVLDRIIHATLFGFIYFIIECIWKGTITDYRMFFLASVIGVLIGLINQLFTYETDFILQCIVGMLIALLCECIFGYQWNLIQELNIWDYSSLPLSAVGGQINLVFAIFWLLLSGICVVLDDVLCWFVGKHGERPYYKIHGKLIYQFPDHKKS